MATGDKFYRKDGKWTKVPESGIIGKFSSGARPPAPVAGESGPEFGKFYRGATPSGPTKAEDSILMSGSPPKPSTAQPGGSQSTAGAGNVGPMSGPTSTPATPVNKAGDKGPGWATVINEQGHRMPIEVGTPMPEGYQLETADMAAQSLRPEPESKLDFTPKGDITSDDFVSAYGDEKKMTELFGAQFEEAQGIQGEVMDTRAAQPGYEESLTGAREAEGLRSAREALTQADRELQDMSVVIANLENDVRRDLGPEVSESMIQAEVQRRGRKLQPEVNRLMANREFALNQVTLAQNFVGERYNAMRADAQEAVDQVMQKYGFAQENMNTAFTLMTNLKQFEMANDQQKSARRDEGRATLSWLIATPGAMNRLTPSQLDSLATQAGVPRSSLNAIQDTLANQASLVGDMKIDDAGNLNYATFNPNTNSFQFHRVANFAHIAPKVTSESIAASKMFSKTTPQMRSALGVISSDIYNADLTDPEVRIEATMKAAFALENVANQTGSDADYEVAKSFRQNFFGSGYGGQTEDNFMVALKEYLNETE